MDVIKRMAEFMVAPPEPPMAYGTEVSSAMALLFLLPMVELAPRYPGTEPWVARVSERLGRAARSEFRLITAVLIKGIAVLSWKSDSPGDAAQLLGALASTPAERLQLSVLQELLAVDGGTEGPAELLRQPERLRRILETAGRPISDDPYPIDADRALGLLQRPEELKALLLTRLGSLWHDHLRPQWERAQPAIQRAAAEAQRHFGAGDPLAVFRAVTGRPMPPHGLDSLPHVRRMVFHPTPFLGPYVGLAVEGGVARVGYGTGIQAGGAAGQAGAPAPEALPGGLLPVLTALADAIRLEMLALVRERGQGCAQDFMAGLGLSQPATSRHLRLLETTGLLRVERIEGIKWYRINPQRTEQVTAALQSFLSGTGRKEPT